MEQVMFPLTKKTRPVFQPVALNTLEKRNAEALAKGLILLQRKAGVGLIYQRTDSEEKLFSNCKNDVLYLHTAKKNKTLTVSLVQRGGVHNYTQTHMCTQPPKSHGLKDNIISPHCFNKEVGGVSK